MKRDIALALSGGGYRAAFFHLGVLRKLNELGLLKRVGVISGVSGGSVVAGSYASALVRGYDFNRFLDNTLDFLSKKTLDTRALLIPTPKSSSARLAASYSKMLNTGLSTDIMMSDLMEIQPQFVINSTAVHSGRGWRFLSGGFVEEWRLCCKSTSELTADFDRYRCDISLARAVAASSAFPVFSALTITRKDLRDIPEEGDVRYFFDDLTDPICLTDGGVTDNSGVTSILAGQGPPESKEDYYLIGSDAGADMPILARPKRGGFRKISYIWRNFEIRGEHNGYLAHQFCWFARMAAAASRKEAKGTALFNIHQLVPEVGETAAEEGKLGQLSTRLKPLDWNTRKRLMNHGASLVWKKLTEHTDLLSPDNKMRRVRRLSLETEPLDVVG